MARTKGALNRPKQQPKELAMSLEQKTQILADILLEVVLDEQKGGQNE